MSAFTSVPTVKPVTQPAGYTGFLSIEGRVINEGGLYSRADNSSKYCLILVKNYVKIGKMVSFTLKLSYIEQMRVVLEGGLYYDFGTKRCG